jgi:nitrogen fixation NifU-like protein
MSNLRELYQELILDHNRSPRNFREMPDANRHVEGRNPVCGDHLSLWLRVSDRNVIEDVSFTGEGCAISKASASLLTTVVKGKTTADAASLFDAFHDLVTGQQTPEAARERLGRLVALAGVSQFPVRVKCASLAWHALRAALRNDAAVVATE